MGPALSSLKPVWMDPTTTKKCPRESFKETTRNTSDSFMILYKKMYYLINVFGSDEVKTMATYLGTEGGKLRANLLMVWFQLLEWLW